MDDSPHTVRDIVRQFSKLPNKGVAMPFIDYNGTQLEVDEDGFIADPSLWNEDLARFLARTAEDIPELTEEHWKVIHYLNKYSQGVQGNWV
jgi:hypothetical protein